MQNILNIPKTVSRKLGHYVYLYINPFDNTIFYVGKGQNSRALSHLSLDDEKEIVSIIKEIRFSGGEPIIEILAHGLKTSEIALRIEAAVIDLLGIDNLANAVRGWKVGKFGRMSIKDLIAHYTEKRANIKVPAILIRVNKYYRYGISDIELYDITRSAWKVGERRRKKAKYAFAVFHGVVREIYCITQWLPAGSTFNVRHKFSPHLRSGRWEFVGTIAEKKIRERYINHHVGHLFPKGAQNPISYVNVV